MTLRRSVALVLLVVLAGGWWTVHETMPGWYTRLWFPLPHSATVRREAERYRLDPALVAAVVHVESRWTPDTTSKAGAVGLMQLMPETARFIASRPDRPSPPPDRLTDPDVNLAYGTWYLRYLIDRYDAVVPALAAYNGGVANADRWQAAARAEGRRLDPDRDITFPETRRFVKRVLGDAVLYRRAYPTRLGAAVPGLAVVGPAAHALHR